MFKLYSFREKGILPEVGAYYDQPNFYLEAMQELDSSIADAGDVREEIKEHENKKVKQLNAMGIQFTQKK